MEQRLGHACGVFGVYAPGQPVAHLAYLGLFALQHRGQESAGIAVSDGETITVVKDMGLVTQVFDERRLAPLDGHLAIGHNRYSTTGSSSWRNAQPVYRSVGDAGFALGHNGNLTNTVKLAERIGMLPGMTAPEFDLDSTTDSALVAELVAQEYSALPRSDGRDLEVALEKVLPRLEGGFSFVLMGEELARQAPVHADMVMPVPESGIPAAQGFARASGIPYGDGVVKNRYIGRTFIAPTPETRAAGVRLKLNPIRENIAGKRLVVVDDSIVRGTTQLTLTRMLREAGAAEVHLRVTSPPYRWPCFYGMDTGRRPELLAADLQVGEVREYLGVDSLAYLDLDRLVAATGSNAESFCTACLSGEYPVPLPDPDTKLALEEGEVRAPAAAPEANVRIKP